MCYHKSSKGKQKYCGEKTPTSKSTFLDGVTLNLPTYLPLLAMSPSFRRRGRLWDHGNWASSAYQARHHGWSRTVQATLETNDSKAVRPGNVAETPKMMVFKMHIPSNVDILGIYAKLSKWCEKCFFLRDDYFRIHIGEIMCHHWSLIKSECPQPLVFWNKKILQKPAMHCPCLQ